MNTEDEVDKPHSLACSSPSAGFLRSRFGTNTKVLQSSNMKQNLDTSLELTPYENENETGKKESENIPSNRNDANYAELKVKTLEDSLKSALPKLEELFDLTLALWEAYADSRAEAVSSSTDSQQDLLSQQFISLAIHMTSRLKPYVPPSVCEKLLLETYSQKLIATVEKKLYDNK